MNSGIYKITCTATNKIYVGSAINLSKRKNNHFHSLKKNKHENSYLQNSFNKYGESFFIFETLEIVEKDNLIICEQKWIDVLKEQYELYNLNMIAGSFLGRKHTDETKKKLSVFRTGQKVSEEVKLKISNSLKDREFSNTHRENLAIKSRGENNARSTLTSEQVILIRNKYIPNEYGYRKLAKEFNTTVSTIEKIITRKRWNHI
jgi:group I intron endonuclease